MNDDYCDCPDGSDEPGTSACSYVSPLSPHYISDNPTGDVNSTPALPGFYCKNKGHIPSYVPFTSVNDGVCDYQLCCDGSDEFEAVGGIKCENRCKEIGKEYKKIDEARQRALGAAVRKRKELVAEAGRMRKEVEDHISDLVLQEEAARIKVKELETRLAEVERQERGKVVKTPGKAGKIAVLLGLAKDRVEELREALSNVRQQRDSSSERVKELEGILAAFKVEYNPNFNDEGVKRAVRAWEDYAAKERPAEPDAAHERDLDEIVKADGKDAGIDWADFESTDEESDVDVCE